MSRKSNLAGVLLVAAAATLTAGCVTEPAYTLPQTMPAPGSSTYGSYGTSPYYGGYGSGYYAPGYSGYSPGYYYSDPMYYGSAGPYAYPYTYGYGYPVYIRCPDNNNDGRCDKRVKDGHDNDHDGDHDGNHEGQWQPRDGAKHPRDARGQVLLVTPKPGQVRVPDAAARAPAPNVAPMPARAPAVVHGDDDDARPRPPHRTPRDPDPRWVPQR